MWNQGEVSIYLYNQIYIYVYIFIYTLYAHVSTTTPSSPFFHMTTSTPKNDGVYYPTVDPRHRTSALARPQVVSSIHEQAWSKGRNIDSTHSLSPNHKQSMLFVMVSLFSVVCLYVCMYVCLFVCLLVGWLVGWLVVVGDAAACTTQKSNMWERSLGPHYTIILSHQKTHIINSPLFSSNKIDI